MEHFDKFVNDLNETAREVEKQVNDGAREIEKQFTEHPEQNNESYCTHLINSLFAAAESAGEAIEHVVHGFCPMTCNHVCRHAPPQQPNEEPPSAEEEPQQFEEHHDE